VDQFVTFLLATASALGRNPEAKFMVPYWGDKVDFGPPGNIGWQADMTNLCAGVNYIPHSGTMNSATDISQRS
jgi:hypothetical protein